jgi:hypothetical protein
VGKAGRLLQTRNYYGEAGVTMGTSVAMGISVAVSTGAAVAVSLGGINSSVFVHVEVGITI